MTSPENYSLYLAYAYDLYHSDHPLITKNYCFPNSDFVKSVGYTYSINHFHLLLELRG